MFRSKPLTKIHIEDRLNQVNNMYKQYEAQYMLNRNPELFIIEDCLKIQIELLYEILQLQKQRGCSN